MYKELLYQNKKIFYLTYGSGKPVMLIHGFGEDGEVWGPLQSSPGRGGLANAQPPLFQNSSLITRFKFIIPDLPGSGKSEIIDDLSMEGLAEVIHTIIHEENIDACQVIGHSMGGYITLALVEKYWNHVSAFGLFHSTAYADSEEKKTTRRKGIEFIQQHGAFEFLKTVIPNLFSPRSKEDIPGTIHEFIRQQHNFSKEALVSYYEAMMQRPDRTEQLQKAAVPVLFIMGKYDAAVPLADGLKQCHLPEKSYIHILQHSGHMGMLEEPERSNRILEEFLLQNEI
ncbi:MAG: alpha/beta hydrolase [Bacteroidetes bacterium]|nr:alpha/beta hydrolase [Bacteroidota bacterium]